MQKHTRWSGTGCDVASMIQKTKVMLSQLIVCIVLFLTVFIGREFFPEKIWEIRENLSKIIVSDTDFRSALTELGKSILDSQDVLGDFRLFCTEVFAPDIISSSSTGKDDDKAKAVRELPSVEQEENFPTDISGLEDGRSGSVTQSLPEEKRPQSLLLLEHNNTSESTVPAVGTILLKADYTGPELSKRDTMDQLSLGNLKTSSPILGRQTSQYGWRTHPISGEQHFHGGVDISGKMGEAIGAFADGTVEYIGRDKSYGIYMQIDHGQGVKSFYAHCSRLCVTKGQKVKIGEKIAEVGSTGCSTGPHLHLELKCGEKRLNPAYYINFLNS